MERPASPESNPYEKVLEDFVVDNYDLEKLESLVNQFNIFEAMGAVRQELRHSDFLAFLLDPRGNHGLGDMFAKRLLQKIAISGNANLLPVSPIDFDVWSLNEMAVRREWHYIDILLEDPSHQLVVAIENKIDSEEHSNQLQRAWETMDINYPGWKILGLLLAPDIRTPSDDRYAVADYDTISRLIEEIVERKATTMGTDVRIMMSHYAQALRRHILSESEIAQLCQRIYQKHKVALDLIFEHRPDQQAALRDVIQPLVEGTPGLDLDACSKTAIRFFLRQWDIPALREGTGWTNTGRILLFEITNQPTFLRLGLYIGPGSIDKRQSLLDSAINYGAPFNPNKVRLNAKWNTLYSRNLVTRQDLEGSESIEELATLIRKAWARFVDIDLPKIRAAFDPKITELNSGSIPSKQ